MRALRRHSTGANFDENVAELMAYLAPEQPGQSVKAIPGAGLDIPIWILGSSTYSAHLAAALGRPYAFASHFAPGELMASLEIYRREFRPSGSLAAPYVMVGVPAFDMCVLGPSSRTTWPKRTRRSQRMTAGPSTKATKSDVTTAPAARNVW